LASHLNVMSCVTIALTVMDLIMLSLLIDLLSEL
jgi:hypothetical protein